MMNLLTKTAREFPRFLLGGALHSNSGGHGHGSDDAKVYQLIGSSTTNNPDNIDLTLQLYYKNNANDEDIRELHGNLVVATTGLADGSVINAGFLFKLKGDEEDNYDGLDVSWKYDHRNIAFPEFIPADLYVKGGVPDVFNDGVDSGVLTRDETEKDDWMIMGSKSSISCYETGNCKFTIHFMRKFQTEDPQDYELFSG